MPTKAGVMRPEDYRQGKTVWVVAYYLYPSGGVSVLPPERLECVGVPFPMRATRCGVGNVSYGYDTRGVALYNEHRGSCETVDMEQLGYPSKGSCPHSVDKIMAFSTKKAAFRHFAKKAGWVPKFEDILLARADAEFYKQQLGIEEISTYPEMPAIKYDRRVKDKRRYLRIPGRGMTKAYAMEKGVLVYSKRDSLESGAAPLAKLFQEATGIKSPRAAWNNKKQVIPGLNRKVHARLPRPPVNNRKARKAIQMKNKHQVKENNGN